jgi:hypothetical protein
LRRLKKLIDVELFIPAVRGGFYNELRNPYVPFGSTKVNKYALSAAIGKTECYERHNFCYVIIIFADCTRFVFIEIQPYTRKLYVFEKAQ